MSTLKRPTVAIIGSTGYVGKCLMPAFLKACQNRDIQELRILTTQGKVSSAKVILSYVASGAKAVPVPSYTDVAALKEALEGVDVLVSALGTQGNDIDNVKEALLDAMVAAKVKVYFPSEFGTNHYKVSYDDPAFASKKKHFNAAKMRGLHTIRVLNGCITEIIFASWAGLDCKAGVWTVGGNGADIPCGITSQRDLSRFTLEAVLLAHEKGSECPDELEVYSDLRTLREFAKAFDKVSGGKIAIKSVPLDSIVEEYNSTKDFTKLIMVMFGIGAYDYSKSTANDLLNPNESKWKLKKIEEFAEETKGIP